MINYIAAFIFYTLAMIGIMLVGLIIYKKTFIMNKSENKGMIKILDSYPIGAKKTLFVVKIKNEKFLIASGAEHTTFLSKLENDNVQKNMPEKKQQISNFSNEFDNEISEVPRFDDNKKSHLEKLQKQFMELYEKEDNQSKVMTKAESKHQIMRQLLDELNETKNIKAGRF